MNKKILALLLAFVLLAATSATVFAATSTGTVVITGGSLSVTVADVGLSGVTLNGSDQTATSASGSNSWSATDARGTGVGWNLTVLGTDFSSGAHTIDIAAVSSKFKIQLLDANIALVEGNTKPSSSVTSLTDIPKVTALKIVTAPVGTGMGSYTLNPNFELEILAETYAGTYTSTITVTAVTGP